MGRGGQQSQVTHEKKKRRAETKSHRLEDVSVPLFLTPRSACPPVTLSSLSFLKLWASLFSALCSLLLICHPYLSKCVCLPFCFLIYSSLFPRCSLASFSSVFFPSFYLCQPDVIYDPFTSQYI